MKKLVFIVFIIFGFIANSQNKKYTTYRVSKKENITSIARKLGVTPYDLLKLNPDAKNGISIDEVLIVPNKNFTISKKTKVEKVKQVAVNNSVVIVKDSIINGFLYHTVKPKETIYSLARKYDVSKRKIRRLNKLNKRSDISIGQVLKFPTDKVNCCAKKNKKIQSVSNINTTDFIIYSTKINDTFYHLQKEYQVTKEELVRINPILKNGLQAGIEIKIPKKSIGSINENTVVQEISIDSLNSEQPKYLIHIVQPKEGYFKLKQLYGVTKEDIKRVNPEIVDGLKVGMKIRIPNKIEQVILQEGDIQNKTLNLVMMLPFELNKQIVLNDNSKQSKRLNKITDFYLGALMALDSVKKKGLSVNVKVIDTKKSNYVVSKIMNTYDFTTTDLVIAPIGFDNYKKIALSLESKQIPVISPVSKKDCSIIKANNTIQNTPSSEILINEMLKHIIKKYSKQKIIIIADEKSDNSTSAKFNIDQIKAKLLKHDSINEVTIIRMKEGYIEREVFDKNIADKKENWVILASDNKSTTSITIENLGVFSDKFKITLFSLLKPKIIDIAEDGYRVKSKYLNKLQFQYPANYFIDNESEELILFNNKYLAMYKGLPSDYSYKGFDTTYDALIRLANKNTKKSVFKTGGASKRLISKFNYQKDNSACVNYGVHIVKYDNFQLKKIE